LSGLRPPTQSEPDQPSRPDVGLPDDASRQEITDGKLDTREIAAFETHARGHMQMFHTEPMLPALFVVPEQLGPWRTVRMLGRGGMGEVWLAERCDGAFSKEVAIKILRNDRADVRDRFRQERQVLAELDHPNIASLIDGGVTPEGLPYLVTEYIEGDSIELWCAKHGCDLRERIAFFLQVCDAVSYAHSQLVVHRDLKPSNTMIDQSGRLHLLDFGIAKLVSGSGHEEVTDESPHTPEYAAPEQVQGGVISVRTDIYALGLLLYGLLSGVRPQERGGGLAHQVEQIVAVVPPLASQALAKRLVGMAAQVGSGGLKISPRQLQGDLDTLIARAIQKNPQDRFASVGEFADDLRRYLAGKAILSRQTTRLERMRRFLQLRWPQVLAGALGSTLLLGGLATAAYQHLRASAQSASAVHRAQETAAARSFIGALLGDLRMQGRTDQALLLQAERYAEAELGAFPELRAGATWDIATTYANLGLYEQRAALIKKYFEHSEQSTDLQTQAAAACAWASIKAEAGERALALTLLARAQTINVQLQENGEQTPWARHDCALTGGRAWRQLGEFERAAQYVGNGIREIEQNPQAMGMHLPDLLLELSSLQIQAGQYLKATGTLKTLIGILDANARSESNVAQVAYHNYGQVSRHLGHFGEAQKAFEQSLRLQGLRNPNTLSANTLCALAVVEQALAQPAAAQKSLRLCSERRKQQQQVPAIQALQLEQDGAEIALAQADWASFDAAMQRIQPLLSGFGPQSAQAYSDRLLFAEGAAARKDYVHAEQALQPLLQPSAAAAQSTLAHARALALAVKLALARNDRVAAQRQYLALMALANENFPRTHPLFSQVENWLHASP
jgi:eukaryotic-like serine/threonine-protein kinase